MSQLFASGGQSNGVSASTHNFPCQGFVSMQFIWKIIPGNTSKIVRTEDEERKKP